MESSVKMEIDEDHTAKVVENATKAVQALEQLKLALKEYEDSKAPETSSMEDVNNLLDRSREVRSRLEGSCIEEVVPPCVKQSIQQQLSLLVRMHVPSSMTQKDKENVTGLVKSIFGESLGQDMRVVMIALVSCPWYVSCHSDRGLQAKHNCLMVLYQLRNDLVFTPLNHHAKDSNTTLDLGWLYITEVYHFAQYLAKGKVRFVETLFLPENAFVYCTPLWDALKTNMKTSLLTGLRGFVEQSRGQAIGSTGRKSPKTGKMIMRDAATLHEFAEGCRLMQHATTILSSSNKEGLQLDIPLNTGHLMDTASKAHHLLSSLYNNDCQNVEREATRGALFECLMQWRHHVDGMFKGFVCSDQKEVDGALGEWLLRVRSHGTQIVMHPLTNKTEEKRSWLSGLLQEIGPSLGHLHIDDVIAVARVGSFLYGLATPTSDVDYIIIFRHDTQGVLPDLGRLKENLESKGPQKALDYGAHEVRLLCEMLLKGSVVVTELVLAEEIEYFTEQWFDLVKMSKIFVTENLILQYFGLIKNNMKDIENGRYKDQPRERKIFYQIFHKLAAVDRMSKGLPPEVKSPPELKDFILRIRSQPLEGDISRENLRVRALESIADVRRRLAERNWRHPEHVDYKKLKEWLLKVRGIPNSQDMT